MIPLQYNARNLVVRWKTTLLTAFGFTLVVSLLVVMLAFVRGLEELARKAGRPGNVLILRDGANDEIFSDIALDERVSELWSNHSEILLDEEGRPLASQEVYCIATQELPPTQEGEPGSYRFLQIRGVEDAEMAGKVHGLALKPGGRWFVENGAEIIVGDGIARTFGLRVGDTFQAQPDLIWTIVGILDSSGSPFDSEIWVKREVAGREFGKDNEERSFYTTIVVTTSDEQTAAAFAADLQNRTQVRINAVPERKYYEEMSKINQVLLGAAIFVAAIMAVGGMFGLMNTMFAAVSQRIKDIGVLRVLGYSGAQILLSFLLESLLIALLGGGLGLLIGSHVHGMEQWGVLSAGPGGAGKAVVFRMTVDAWVLALTIAFTLAMGVLGGLLPAWTAMRLKVLESLR